jgi:uncharacterized protein YndB with AHSA1/START domain
MTDAPEIRDIAVEVVLPQPPPIVWRTLTISELIGRWLMANDFSAVVGKKFMFRTGPIGDWDGLVDCEIVEIVENRRLVYRWKAGLARSGGRGSRLDTLVAWTLAPTEGGTKLTMLQSGFQLPENQVAYDAMNPGWGQVMRRLERVVEQEGRA